MVGDEGARHARIGDARGAHGRGDDEAVDPVDQADQGQAVRREGLGPVDELVDRGARQAREQGLGPLGIGPELGPVLVEQGEGEAVGRRAAGCLQGDGIRVEAAEQQAADLLAAVERIVRRDEGGRRAGQARLGPGDDVEMLAAPLTQRDVERRQHAPRPQPGADHDRVQLDRAVGRGDAGDAPAFGQDRLDRAILPDRGAALAGGTRVGCGEPGRIEPPRAGVEPDSRQPGGVEQGVEGHRLGRGDGAEVVAALPRVPRLALEARRGSLLAGEEKTARGEPARVLSGFRLSPAGSPRRACRRFARRCRAGASR